MTEITIEDVKKLLKGDYLNPVMHVRDDKDPLYVTIKDIVMKVYPEAEDYKANITTKFSNIIDEMRYMEPHDYNKIVNTFKKYAVAGKNRGITGERTYGYDISRVDRKMIRRRRPN